MGEGIAVRDGRGLRLEGQVKPVMGVPGIADGTLAVSVFLVNRRAPEAQGNRDGACVFDSLRTPAGGGGCRSRGFCSREPCSAGRAASSGAGFSVGHLALRAELPPRETHVRVFLGAVVQVEPLGVAGRHGDDVRCDGNGFAYGPE